MTNETLRMQMLAGVITEGQYKAKLQEFDMNQFSMGNPSSPKASFEDKWNDVPNANKEILKKSTGKEPVKIMASSKGENYVITKGSDGKFYTYQYTQAENPGKPMGPFNSENEAKKLNESLNESMIGGIVGIGAINQIPPREKTNYELAFEHFLGERYENREQDPYTMKEAKDLSFTFNYNTDEDDVAYIQRLLKQAGVDATAKAGIDSEEMVVKASNAIELRKAKKAISSDGFQIHENREQDPYTMEEAEMPAVDSRIKNDANFQKLVAYLKQNPDEAEDVNAEIKTLEEDWIKGDKGYSMQDGVDSTYVYFKDGKYYKRQSLSDRSGFGNTYTTDEISKEDFQKIQKEYVKEKLMKIGLGAAAVGFVGALMAGPLGAMDPGNILQAALVAAGFGGAAASIFEKEEVEEGKEVEEPSLYEEEVNENVGSTLDKMLQTFEFSEKGNDEMIEFGNYILSPEGPKNIAMSIKTKLKGEGGENYFTSKPEELDAFLSKLK